MAIVNDLQKIRDWLQSEVCNKLTLKLPDDKNAGEGYTLKLVHPTAFALYTPTKDRLPPDILLPIPSVCLRLVEGEQTSNSNKMQLILNFCTWNPGAHMKFKPVKIDGDIESYNAVASEYQRNADGWQDVFNFIDTTLRTLESTEYIADMRVVVEDGIKYGMTSDKDGLDDFYPYWMGWITFSIQSGNVRKKSYDEFL